MGSACLITSCRLLASIIYIAAERIGFGSIDLLPEKGRHHLDGPHYQKSQLHSIWRIIPVALQPFLWSLDRPFTHVSSLTLQRFVSFSRPDNSVEGPPFAIWQSKDPVVFVQKLTGKGVITGRDSRECKIGGLLTCLLPAIWFCITVFTSMILISSLLLGYICFCY